MLLLGILAGACGLSLLVIPLVRRLAIWRGLVDRPDNHRKMHARPIPLAGGPAILIASSTALAVAFLFAGEYSHAFELAGFRFLGLLVCGTILCAIGVADDYHCLRGRHKLLGQVLVCIILTQFDWIVPSLRFFSWDVDLGTFKIPFTVIWLLATINSLNLLDGMDGLLGTVGGLLSLALAGIALLSGLPAMAALGLALAGSLAGFLRYNLPPAKVFLGDSGSMLIGLVLGALAIFPARPNNPFAPTVTVVLFTLPFLDTLAAIIRRRLTGRSIYTTDRGHLPHCLLRQGLSAWGVLLRVAAFMIVLSAGALAGTALRQGWIAGLASLGLCAYLIVSRTFADAEFSLLLKRCVEFGRTLLRRPTQPGGRETVDHLQGSVNWAELWGNLISGASDLDLLMMRLNVNAPALHEGYHARWDSAHGDHEDPLAWSAEVPLSVEGQIIGRLKVIGRPGKESIREKIDALLKLAEYFELEAADLLDVKLTTKPRVPVETRPPEIILEPEATASSPS